MYNLLTTTYSDEDETHDKLHDLIEELDEALHGVKREQEYMDVREKTHRLSMLLWCLSSVLTCFFS